ncbi:MAG: NfeD family protein [Bacteroidales bacterium]|jgi:membrane-bound ClpP family serine protease|nr:NfeD family protein [Bacteroidales bacterium]
MDLFLILLIMIGGVGLVILELLAIPGTTIAGLSGIGLLGYGIYEVFVGYGALWGGISIVVALSICIALLIYSLRSKTWNKFSLNKEINSKVNVIGNEIAVGDKGVSVTRLAPMGMAEIKEQRIEVYTSTSYVEPNTPLIVEAIDGNRVRVRPQE